MPRGVPKAGFRMTKKRKAKSKRRSFSTPSKEKREINQKAVNKKPVKVEAPVLLEMDVEAFLVKIEESIKVLREAAALTTHTAEKELLSNFATCIERQVPQKYRIKEDDN